MDSLHIEDYGEDKSSSSASEVEEQKCVRNRFK
jgi:hypothetical protein